MWLDNTFISTMQDPADRSLLANEQIAYQGGKGNNHLVSIVIPQDTVVAMKLLAVEVVRESAGILTCNRYMFPYVLPRLLLHRVKVSLLSHQLCCDRTKCSKNATFNTYQLACLLARWQCLKPCFCNSRHVKCKCVNVVLRV